MEVFRTLMSGGFTWRIEPCMEERIGQHARAGEIYHVPFVKIFVTETASFPVKEHWIKLDPSVLENGAGAQVMRLIRKRWPDHPLVAAELHELGIGDKVKLTKEDIECVSESTHTALRKICDGPYSVLMYNGVFHLPDGMWANLCERTQTALRALPKKGLDRYTIGMTVKQTWLEAIDTWRYDENMSRRRHSGYQSEKEKAAEYALTNFKVGADMASDGEWVWGICGYLGTTK